MAGQGLFCLAHGCSLHENGGNKHWRAEFTDFLMFLEARAHFEVRIWLQSGAPNT